MTLLNRFQTVRGKEKSCLKSKILTYLKSAHQEF